MIDFHALIVHAVEPVKVRPKETYLSTCVATTDSRRFEVMDSTAIITSAGRGTGVIENPQGLEILLFHLGNALTVGPRKINNLPSACDLIIHSDRELIIAELTESNERSLVGVDGGRNPGKLKKAETQLSATASLIEKTGYLKEPLRKTAIFFFRLPPISKGVAARSVNAFGLRPTLQRVTTYTLPSYPDWEFRNHPYPHPYVLRES